MKIILICDANTETVKKHVYRMEVIFPTFLLNLTHCHANYVIHRMPIC